MQKIDTWKIIKNIFKFAVSFAAIYWLSKRISFSELWQTLKDCNPFNLLLALIAYITSQIVASSRLTSFFKANGIYVTERYNLRLYQLGLLYNYFIPGGIGGDAYKIFLLKKRFDYSGKKLLSAVFFDRLSGLWALSIVVGGLVIMMPRLSIPNYLTVAILILGTGTYYSILRLFFKPFAKSFLLTHFKALLVQGFQAIATVLLLYALNFDGKFSPYILIFMVSQLVAIVPSILGAVGLRESVVSFLATYLNLNDHLSVLTTVLFNFISIIVAATGVYYIIRPQGLGADKLPSADEVEREIEKDSNNEED